MEELKTKDEKLEYIKARAWKEFMCHKMKKANVWRTMYYNLEHGCLIGECDKCSIRIKCDRDVKGEN
jgi:hypothetical protein